MYILGKILGNKYLVNALGALLFFISLAVIISIWGQTYLPNQGAILCVSLIGLVFGVWVFFTQQPSLPEIMDNKDIVNYLGAVIFVICLALMVGNSNHGAIIWLSILGMVLGGWMFRSPRPHQATSELIIATPTRTFELEPTDEHPSAKQFTLILGQPETWESNKARILVDGLLNLSRGSAIDFRFLATEAELFIAIRYATGYPTLEAVHATVQSTYPDMEVRVGSIGLKPVCPVTFGCHVFSRNLEYPFFETSTHTNFSDDPLALLTLAMDRVQAGEVLCFGITVRDTITFTEEQRQDLLTISKWDMGERPRRTYRKSFVQQAVDTYYETTRLQHTQVSVYKAGDERRFEQKLSQPNYLVNIWLYIETPDPKRLQWFDTLVSQVKGLATSHPLIVEGTAEKQLVTTEEEWQQAYPPLLINQWETPQFNRHLFAVTLDELSALWHIPHDTFRAKNLQWKVNAPLPDELKGIEGVLVGHSGRDEVRLPTSLKFKTEHMAVIGRTGMGKSSLFHTQIHDDIEHSRGVIVIDPKGNLVRDILRYSVPPEREDDVIVLDIYQKIGDHRYPPPLNPLSGNPDDLTAILDQLFKKSWSDTRASDWVSLALHTLKFFDGATIRDITRVIKDKEFRDKLVRKGATSTNADVKLAIAGLRNAWQSYDDTVEKQSSIDAINRRLDTFTTDGQLLALTCNPQPLKLAEWLEDNKIILIALGHDFEGKKGYAKPLKKQELQILGTSLVSQIFHLAMAGRIPIQNRPYTLYIDEAHLFKTAPLDEMLALVRGRGLGMVLSTQSLNLLVEGMQDAFDDNVGTLVSFQVSSVNANQLTPYMSPPFAPEDLSKLNRYQCAVYLKDENGTQYPAFQLTTKPPPGFEQELVVGVDGDENAVAKLKNEQIQRQNHAIKTEFRIRQKSVDHMELKTYSEVADLIIGEYDEDDISEFTIKDYDEDDEVFIFPDEDEPKKRRGRQRRCRRAGRRNIRVTKLVAITKQTYMDKKNPTHAM